MYDYAITYGGVKRGEPYLFLDELDLLDEDEGKTPIGVVSPNMQQK